VVLLVALVAGACGGSSSGPSSAQSTGASGVSARPPLGASPPAGSAQGEVGASLGVESSARLSDGLIAPHYTCRGANVSVPVTWVGVSSKAKEIAILVRSFLGPGRFAVNWAVAGISPSLDGIAAGRLPPGAVVGLNSFGREGYSLCPAAGAPVPVTWIAVLALPHRLALDPGFDPATVEAQSTLPGVQWGSLLAYNTKPSAGHAPR
jgi:phosphatidylethanolamine-binding protein (PEBP) family uncharacterized protein